MVARRWKERARSWDFASSTIAALAGKIAVKWLLSGFIIQRRCPKAWRSRDDCEPQPSAAGNAQVLIITAESISWVFNFYTMSASAFVDLKVLPAVYAHCMRMESRRKEGEIHSIYALFSWRSPLCNCRGTFWVFFLPWLKENVTRGKCVMFSVRAHRQQTSKRTLKVDSISQPLKVSGFPPNIE